MPNIYSREYYLKNRKRMRQYNEEYKLANKEKCKKYDRDWVKNNPKSHSAKIARYRTAKLQRTPKWADLKAIKEFYENRPDGMHVDHIIPLRGINVSGLHVENNLQYLTPSENCAKYNRFMEN